MSSHNKFDDFGDRLATAANARKTALEKFRAQPAPDDPVVLERLAAQKAVAEARAARAAERKAARDAEAARLEAERQARIAAEHAAARAKMDREEEAALRAASARADMMARAAAAYEEKKARAGLGGSRAAPWPYFLAFRAAYRASRAAFCSAASAIARAFFSS